LKSEISWIVFGLATYIYDLKLPQCKIYKIPSGKIFIDGLYSKCRFPSPKKIDAPAQVGKCIFLV